MKRIIWETAAVNLIAHFLKTNYYVNSFAARANDNLQKYQHLIIIKNLMHLHKKKASLNELRSGLCVGKFMPQFNNEITSYASPPIGVVCHNPACSLHQPNKVYFISALHLSTLCPSINISRKYDNERKFVRSCRCQRIC